MAHIKRQYMSSDWIGSANEACLSAAGFDGIVG